MNWIELSFQNAALCLDIIKNGRVSDYVYDPSVKEIGKRWQNRIDHETAKKNIMLLTDEKLLDKNPIGFKQVSNMLHVLCGCRPVSSIKERPFKRERLKIIDDIAKNAWVKISNIYYTEKDGKKKPLSDFTQGKKFVHNANRQDLFSPLGGNEFVKGGYITWDSLYKRYYFFDNNKYHRIISQLENWYSSEGMKDKYTLCGLLLYLANERGLKEQMETFFEKEEMKPFVQIIEGKDKINPFNNACQGNNNNFNFARMPVNTTPCYKMYLNGSIVVPIEDEMIFNLIINGVRNCTFLDGGNVSIKRTTDFFDENWLEMEGFGQILKEEYSTSDSKSINYT